MKLSRALKHVSYGVFQIAQRFGLFVMPAHYYVPIANTHVLKQEMLRWNQPVDTRHMPMSLDSQIAFLRRHIAPFEPEYRGNQAYNQAARDGAGPGYGYIEAQALHGVMRSIQPTKVIEVGSGVSTRCMMHAADLNHREGGPACSITCIEPYPSAELGKLDVTLIQSRVEEVDLSVFDQLSSGDMLFIDSSHALRPGGDVTRLYLEVLPRLKSGVWIHIHDIYIPYLFQRDVTHTYMQWMETALLVGMLQHSQRYTVELCLSHLFCEAPSALKECFPEFVPALSQGGLDVERPMQGHFPASTYLRVN